MLEDRLLVWRFRQGNREALRQIYAKYRNDLLRVAVSLLNERHLAEDVVHDVFIGFVRSSASFRLTGSLKGYLATCVANRARNVNRSRQSKQTAGLDGTESVESSGQRPERWIIASEELKQLNRALAQLPYEQREAVILHLQGGLKFREISRSQDVSIKTVQSRYRYGLAKLRSLLDGEV